jgi:hypothetical protein
MIRATRRVTPARSEEGTGATGWNDQRAPTLRQ